MRSEIEAIYENGTLRPIRAIPLRNGARVLVTIETVDECGTKRIPGEEVAREEGDLLRFFGSLKGSALCTADPVETQRRLRDEWS
jgi:predicted DNA-binding antitoxin AbrB/MazE fold protein